jgi:hypothetical protein
VRDLYDNLRAGHDFTVVSQFPETYVTYMIPLEHFVGTIINSIIGPDTWSVGPSSEFIPPDGPFYYGPTRYDYSYWECGG